MDLLKQPGVVLCEFKKGEYIIRQGEEIQYLYYLMSGTCHRSTITEKGDEIVFGVKKSSENFVQSTLGVLIIYSNGISSNNFIADTTCKCYRIPKKNFLHYIKDKPELLNQLITLAMYELRELAGSFQARQEGKVANRLCEQLLKNAQLRQGKLIVNKDYSNYTTIGRFLGIHKVTVAKILKALKEEGIIDKDKQGIIILNEKLLTSYARAEKTIDY
ncbi:Crp/Fnr family transcriptional regulator [Desulforamulus aquiferis]|uniref:Crp/Fnr family transcriptional regulator n=1 Tax=Desulforamulus aquiferis TaxID=1397668 RepID=A0AAW7ZBL2_9FIRM|nr:Crp/Fnr family transcriptional regulator [Desulforamulus aquiferis]MDO7786609.1 Crp/Fnr family transcriptional regulator [Desulforamulus aquiferis]RYD05810.1 cyclic nucleotide-binding protein [Desulforamulus aquiferis]